MPIFDISLAGIVNVGAARCKISPIFMSTDPPPHPSGGGGLKPRQALGEEGEEAVGIDAVDHQSVGRVTGDAPPIDHRAPEVERALGLDGDIGLRPENSAGSSR